MFCPRREDQPRSFASFAAEPIRSPYIDPEFDNIANRDTWREDNTCSYCGSYHPTAFVELVRNGSELIPTDKAYKAYIEIPDPDEGKLYIKSSSNSVESPGAMYQPYEEIKDLLTDLAPGTERFHSEWYRWVWLEPRKATKRGKFYYQHLAHRSQERADFYDLFMLDKIKIGHPGYLYGGNIALRWEHVFRNPEELTDAERRGIELTRKQYPIEQFPQVLIP